MEDRARANYTEEHTFFSSSLKAESAVSLPLLPALHRVHMLRLVYLSTQCTKSGPTHDVY